MNYLVSLTEKMNNPFDLLIDSYLDNKIGIDPGFMSKSLSDGLQQNILHQKMRSDKIY